MLSSIAVLREREEKTGFGVVNSRFKEVYIIHSYLPTYFLSRYLSGAYDIPVTMKAAWLATSPP